MKQQLSRVPFFKQNLLWPLAMGGAGLVTGTLILRYESAIRHLMLTPRGSLLVDPNYGTTIYKHRTQGITEATSSLIKADLSDAMSVYLPDLLLADVQVSQDPSDDETLLVTAIWLINSESARDLITSSSASPPTANRLTVVV